MKNTNQNDNRTITKTIRLWQKTMPLSKTYPHVSREAGVMEPKEASHILNCLLQDADVLAACRSQVPGSCKRASVTKGQRTWIWNLVKKKYLPVLTVEDRQHYGSTNFRSGQAVSLMQKAVLMRVLGVNWSEPSTSGAPASSSSWVPVPQRQPKGQGRAAKTKATTKKRAQHKGLVKGKKRHAVTLLAESVLKFTGCSVPRVCRLLRKVVGKLDIKCPGVRQELLKDEPEVDCQLPWCAASRWCGSGGLPHCDHWGHGLYSVRWRNLEQRLHEATRLPNEQKSLGKSH